jgi:hypothetical protein
MKRVFVAAAVFFLAAACAAVSKGERESQDSAPDGFSGAVGAIVKELARGDKVAVSQIYDGASGDFTSLGDRLRDRIETSLIERGLSVVPRRDLAVLMDERELGGEEAPEVKELKAKAVISGRYYISKEKKAFAELHLRALSVSENRIIGGAQIKEPLPQDWLSLVVPARGNIFLKKIEGISPSGTKGPALTARLDRKEPCYPAGASVRIHVKSEQGVHLYILNLAADGTVTMLYPNRMIPDAPLAIAELEFPPPALAKTLGLAVYPIKSDENSQEAFKVIASRGALDFSFLPVPENEIYAGARGERLAKVLDVLRKAQEWSEVNLGYWVGPGCSR